MGQGKRVLLSLLVSGSALFAEPSAALAQSDDEFFRCVGTEVYRVDDEGEYAGQARPMREFLPRVVVALDSLAEAGEFPRDSVEVFKRALQSNTAWDVHEEFVVERSTGRIIHERLRNFGRGWLGTENPGEPRVVEVSGYGVSDDYIAVTVRVDEVNTWSADAEYLRIYDNESEQRTFIYIDGNYGILTGTCKTF